MAGERSMNPDTTLQALVERYLDERHRLGFSARTQAYALRSFARHVHAVGHHGPITIEVMADWARADSHASSDPRTWARRLKLLRSFMRWLLQFEPGCEVPDDAIFGRLPERLRHIFTVSRKSSTCWPLRGSLGLRPAYAASSTRRCLVCLPAPGCGYPRRWH